MTHPLAAGQPGNGRQLLSTDTACVVHAKHHPQSHQRVRHHVWPLSHGGPDTEDNVIAVCPTGHTNVHVLLALLLLSQGRLPWTEHRSFTTGERHWAGVGYQRIRRGHM